MLNDLLIIIRSPYWLMKQIDANLPAFLRPFITTAGVIAVLLLFSGGVTLPVWGPRLGVGIGTGAGAERHNEGEENANRAGEAATKSDDPAESKKQENNVDVLLVADQNSYFLKTQPLAGGGASQQREAADEITLEQVLKDISASASIRLITIRVTASFASMPPETLRQKLVSLGYSVHIASEE